MISNIWYKIKTLTKVIFKNKMYDNYDEDPFETNIFESVEEDVLWNTNSDGDKSDLFAKNDEDEEVKAVIDEPLETEDGEDLAGLGLHITDDEEEKEEEL